MWFFPKKREKNPRPGQKENLGPKIRGLIKMGDIKKHPKKNQKILLRVAFFRGCYFLPWVRNRGARAVKRSPMAKFTRDANTRKGKVISKMAPMAMTAADGTTEK